MKLICIDFDGTIPKDNLHDIIARATYEDHDVVDNEQKQWDLVKKVPPRGYKRQWKNHILEMIEGGNLVAIVSFNDYPHIIRKYLIEAVGLPENIVDKIHIQAGLPENPNAPEKVAYIERALQAVNKRDGLDLQAQDIVFIDDSWPNCQEARKKFTTIHAPNGNNNFFMTIKDHLEYDPDAKEDEEYSSDEDDNSTCTDTSMGSSLADSTDRVFSVMENEAMMINEPSNEQNEGQSKAPLTDFFKNISVAPVVEQPSIAIADYNRPLHETTDGVISIEELSQFMSNS
jgi:hypothetical protein